MDVFTVIGIKLLLLNGLLLNLENVVVVDVMLVLVLTMLTISTHVLIAFYLSCGGQEFS